MRLGVYRVKLDVFEGPLDLLLHLIKRNEVEITDIPIALVTDQYLAALEELDDLNLDGAGEYVLMAATLMLIKSRMLLPRDPATEEDEEEDPRAELVQQLIEYQRYREAALQLGDRPVLRREVFRPPGEAVDSAAVPADEPTVRDASLGDLLGALRGLLERARLVHPHEIRRPGISIAECVNIVLARFGLDDEVEFSKLFDADATTDDVIVTFLTLLELIRLGVLNATQPTLFGSIIVRLAVADLAEATKRARELNDPYSTIGEDYGDADGRADV